MSSKLLKNEPTSCKCITCYQHKKRETPTPTPTPWEVDDGTQPHTIAIVNHEEQHAVAVLHHDNPIDHANAALIVRAVNAHEDLILTLKDELEWLREMEHFGTITNQNVKLGLANRAYLLEQAIAKAEGKETANA